LTPKVLFSLNDKSFEVSKTSKDKSPDLCGVTLSGVEGQNLKVFFFILKVTKRGKHFAEVIWKQINKNMRILSPISFKKLVSQHRLGRIPQINLHLSKGVKWIKNPLLQKNKNSF
jgi:hypothetical protein